jgi:hypothetical protein
MRAVRARRVAVTAWITLTTSGCMAWRVESAPPREVLQREGLGAVRITSVDSTAAKVEIYDPTLVGDSISGHPTKQAVARIYLPLSQVRTIATQHKSIGKTALVILGAGAAVAVYALLQSLNPPSY